MTCIVALEHNGDVFVGADSAGIAGWDLCTRADQKVFINEDFIMGFCGSFRLGQLLRYSFTPPDRSCKQEDDMAYMVNDFVDAVRALLKDKGLMKTDGSDADDMIESSFIVGYRGKIYTVESDFQVGMHTKPYFAVGAGAQIALGSLHSTESESDPQKRLITALEAASTFCAAVCAPYTVLSSENPKEEDENEHTIADVG